MKTVVITGSARGLGYEMAKEFRYCGYNTVLSDINEENLLKAKETLEEIKSEGKVLTCICDVSKYEDNVKLMEKSIRRI